MQGHEFCKDHWMPQFDDEVRKPLRWAKTVSDALSPLFHGSKDSKVGAMRVVNQDRPEVVDTDLGEKTAEWVSYVGDASMRGHMMSVYEDVVAATKPTVVTFAQKLDEATRSNSFVKAAEVDDPATYRHDLEALLEWDYAEDVNKIRNCALDIGDIVLQRQLVFIDVCMQLAQATGRLSLRSLKATTREATRLSPEVVPMIRALRSALACAKQRNDNMGDNIFGKSANDPKHMICEIDPILDSPADWIARLCSEGQEVHDFLAAQAEQDCTELCGLLNSYCPAGWQFYKENLLEQEAVVKALLSNEHYQKIGPGMNMLETIKTCA